MNSELYYIAFLRDQSLKHKTAFITDNTLDISDEAHTKITETKDVFSEFISNKVMPLQANIQCEKAMKI